MREWLKLKHVMIRQERSSYCLKWRKASSSAKPDRKLPIEGERIATKKTIRWHHFPRRTAQFLKIYSPSTSGEWIDNECNNRAAKRERYKSRRGKNYLTAIISPLVSTSIPSTSNLLTFSILRGLCSSPWHTLSPPAGPLPRVSLL